MPRQGQTTGDQLREGMAMGIFRSKASYETDIRLGERYRDEQTGIEGVATCVSFYQHGCERVSLEVVRKGEIKTYGFDAPRLKSIVTGQQATTTRTGGPGDPAPDRHDAARYEATR